MTDLPLCRSVHAYAVFVIGIACAWHGGGTLPAFGDENQVVWHVGKDFQKQLQLPSPISWSEQTVRRGLTSLSKSQQIAIWLDRRIDPDGLISITTRGETLHATLRQIAQELNVGVGFVGNVVYIGPPEAVASLKSEMKKRTAELQRLSRRLPRRRRRAMLRRHTLHWNDLDSPAKLLENQAARFQLKILGDRKVSHDLWAGATIPTASCVELLSLILIQYDLTFRWGRRGASIQLVPIGKNDDGSIGNNSSRN